MSEFVKEALDDFLNKFLIIDNDFINLSKDKKEWFTNYIETMSTNKHYNSYIECYEDLVEHWEMYIWNSDESEEWYLDED